MGMYTGIRFEARLRADALPIVTALYEVGGNVSRWGAVAEQHPLPWLQAWARVGRCDFIPFGALAYMPADWKETNLDPPVDGVWRVCCSLKNYQGEIGIFLDAVLPHLIAESCTCEVLYEEDDAPQLDVVLPAAPEPQALPEGGAPITHDGPPRAYQVCKCCDCGVVKRCTPSDDFYGTDGGALRCEPCMMRHHNLGSKPLLHAIPATDGSHIGVSKEQFVEFVSRRESKGDA
jgi:hypothetical protein